MQVDWNIDHYRVVWTIHMSSLTVIRQSVPLQDSESVRLTNTLDLAGRWKILLLLCAPSRHV